MKARMSREVFVAGDASLDCLLIDRGRGVKIPYIKSPLVGVCADMHDQDVQCRVRAKLYLHKAA